MILTFFVFLIVILLVFDCALLYVILVRFNLLIENLGDVLAFLDRSEKRIIRHRRKGKK